MPKLNTSILTATDRAAHRQILFVAIGDLIPDPDNPRKHGRAQISAIAKSIEAFGFNAPILVEKNNKLSRATAGPSTKTLTDSTTGDQSRTLRVGERVCRG